jgi:GAF domain-containing protein
VIERLRAALEAANASIAERDARQAATSEILNVIASSPTDVQPVFDAIVASAVRLLGAYSGTLTRVVGDQVELAATTSTYNAGDAAQRASFPQPLQSEQAHPQVIRNRTPLNIADAHTDLRIPHSHHVAARARGYRSVIVVPLVRHDEGIGAISVTRREPGGFTNDEVALLQTFADQAVIAIENVRLFTELDAKNRALTSALDTQTATSDILRVISRSPTDEQPVFDAIVHSAQRLLRGHTSTIRRLVDGQLVSVAFTPMTLEGERVEGGRKPYPAARAAIAVFEGRPWIVPDVLAEPEIPAEAREQARARGYRSVVGVPLVRAHEVIGVLFVSRREVGGFTEDEVALLQVFADQAVIAIENVRLFAELDAKNHALTSALDQQTATGEILRIIASSPTDVQPVFEAIADNALRLLNGWSVIVWRPEANTWRPAALRGAHEGSEGPDAAARFRS